MNDTRYCIVGMKYGPREELLVVGSHSQHHTCATKWACWALDAPMGRRLDLNSVSSSFTGERQRKIIFVWKPLVKRDRQTDRDGRVNVYRINESIESCAKVGRVDTRWSSRPFRKSSTEEGEFCSFLLSCWLTSAVLTVMYGPPTCVNKSFVLLEWYD